MMSLNKIVIRSQKLTFVISHLPKCLLSTGVKHSAKYGPVYFEPNPDPAFYRRHPPDPSDKIATRPVKAAPTSQTYSNFYDKELHKFEKNITKKGNSETARRIVRGTIEYIKTNQVKKYHRASPEERDSIEVNPLIIFHQALENAKPLIGLQSVKKGGRSYRVPVAMEPKKQFFFVMKAMTSYVWSGNKPDNDASIRFGREILAAYNNEGAAVKAKQDIHKQAYANRAFGNLVK